jgi:arginase family enzyme
VSDRIGRVPAGSVTFLGSGDFHHITSLLIDKLSDDISVICFDDHPDWDIFPPKIGCGSWVTRVLARANVKKVLLIGASSGDISPTLYRMGNYDSLNNDRLEIYPYQHKATKVFFKKIPRNMSASVKRGIFYDEIHWQELKTKNMAEFFLHVLRRLPTKKVYVTIDKDCLRNAYALTNWAQGHLEMEELLLMLKLIKENTEIAGLDVTGDYSPVRTEGIVRTAITAMNHPRDFSAKGRPRSLIDSVNEAANIRILELLDQ